MGKEEKQEREFLCKMVRPGMKIIIEIGCWIGKGSECLALGIKKRCPDAKLFCIDPFDNAYFSSIPGLKKLSMKYNIAQVFEDRMRHYQHTTMRTTSS